MVVDPSDIRQVPEVAIAPETWLDRLERLAKLGKRALVEQCDLMGMGQAGEAAVADTLQTTASAGEGSLLI